MRAIQREAGRGVVEGDARPVGCVVASGAIRRKPKLLVVRVRGPVVVVQVTGHARGLVEVVVVIHVARRTRQAGMRAGQGEAGGRVVEGCRRPVRSRVTGGAIRREARRLVGRVVGVVVIGLVTRHAGGHREAEVASHMARNARHRRVRAGQRKAGFRVVKRGRCPTRGGVALRAIRRVSELLMVRVGGCVVGIDVTGRAIRRRPSELAVDVT